MVNEIVIERNEKAEVPYELVMIKDANGNGRLHTRNIRDAAGEAEKAENVVAVKEKEVEEAKEAAEKAKKKAVKKKVK